MTQVVGILTYPFGEDFGLSAAPRRTLRRAYRRALYERANPRTPEYMRSLFAERYPNAPVVDDLPAGEACELVLLYPDAIGLGFGRLERRLPQGVSVRVLNGRRREYAFDRRARSALQIRRALERAMIVEVIGLTFVLLATPFLAAFDYARGRR
jgi:hypothetical protein